MTQPLPKPTHATAEKIIDHLTGLLKRRFTQDVSQIYFGDIGVYLPSSFGSSRRDQKAIIALSPAYNREREDLRVGAFEYREIGIDIITMVNITPFFQASPDEAYGERLLVRLTTDIGTFLAQDSNVNLGGLVHFAKVGDYNWAWSARGDQSIRAAAVAFECRVRIPRM